MTQFNPVSKNKFTYLVGALVESIKTTMDSVGDRMLFRLGDIAVVADGMCHGLLVQGEDTLVRVVSVQTSMAGNIAATVIVNGSLIDEETGELIPKVMFHKVTLYRDGELTKPNLVWYSYNDMSIDLFKDTMVRVDQIPTFHVCTRLEIEDVVEYISTCLDAESRARITENFQQDAFIFNDPRWVDVNPVDQLNVRLTKMIKQLTMLKIKAKVLKFIKSDLCDAPEEQENQLDVYTPSGSYTTHDQLIDVKVAGLSNIPAVKSAISKVVKDGSKSVSNVLIYNVFKQLQDELKVDDMWVYEPVRIVTESTNKDIKMLTDMFGAEMNHYRYVLGEESTTLTHDLVFDEDVKPIKITIDIKK